MSEVLWEPAAESREMSQMMQFARLASERSGRDLTDYRDLHAFSIDDPAAFWSLVWSFCEVIGDRGSDRVIEAPEDFPGARFFPDARLNFAENLIRRHDDVEAMVSYGEHFDGRAMGYAELREQVASLAAALRAQGVGAGDRVAAYLANIPESIVGMLATASIGAVWSSCSPDFGEAGVIDRFGQIEPKVLIACDGYRYAGRPISCLERLPRILSAIPSIERCLVVPFLEQAPRLDGLHSAELWPETLSRHSGAPLEFVRLPFDHPLYNVFSSGTTGKPKCIVHSAGGALIQHLKEHRLHLDLRTGETLFYFTTCGWMMWNWLVSGLASGARLVLYDGSPFHPSGHRLFEIAERECISVFGTSAKFIDALAKSDVRPGRDHDLSSMRTLLSTGSPLSPEGFDFVYREIRSELQLASISGGTDILSCFVLGNPTLPVRRGEIQCAGLGMAVAVYDEAGRRVREQQGELVCERPFPSMPIGFHGDEDGRRYRAAYFEGFPGVWCHGDFTLETATGGYMIHGRSDAVLNPGGVRIGTAEIYRQVERLEEVEESIAIGQQHEGDVRVILFVRLREGRALDDELIARIRKTIRENTTPRHVPARVLSVPDIPRTRSGKITELAVRDVVHGRAVANVEALANPEALEHFRDRPELER